MVTVALHAFARVEVVARRREIVSLIRSVFVPFLICIFRVP